MGGRPGHDEPGQPRDVGREFGIGLTGGLVTVAVDPDWLAVFDQVVAGGTRALWEAITQPFALLMLPLLGVVLLWRASRLKWGQVLAAATFALVALVVTAGVVNYPVQAASVADETLAATVTSVNETVLGTRGERFVERGGRGVSRYRPVAAVGVRGPR